MLIFPIVKPRTLLCWHEKTRLSGFDVYLHIKFV